MRILELNPFLATSIFSSIPLISQGLAKIKSGEPVDFNQFSARVTPTGFKPVTAGAEIQNSIQLNYGAI